MSSSVLRQLANDVQREADKLYSLRSEANAQAEEFAKFLRSDLQARSSGPFTTQYLRQFSPGLYSVASPRPPMDPSFINEQKGVFKRDWIVTVRYSGGTICVHAENIDPIGVFLEHGTSKMIMRPLGEAAMRDDSPIFEQYMLKALGG